MSNYITTDWLNLRSEAGIPAAGSSNVIAVLPPGTVVEKIASGSIGKWVHVKTLSGNNFLTGFASSLYLEQSTATLPASAPVTPMVPAVHLPLKDGKAIRRSEVNGRAFHLQEAGMKTFDLREFAGTAAAITKIYETINWIDVEHGARYAPASTSTYCNIYAYDVCWCCGLYIPRVWWNENAFNLLMQGKTPEVIYETTVTELNANALADWFEKYGSLFGWTRVNDIGTLQQKVNTGTLGIIVGQRINLNRSGHIVAILPETAEHKAQRDAVNNIISPLQSQAGVVNRKYYTGNNWWANPNKFRKFGFWVWEKQ